MTVDNFCLLFIIMKLNFGLEISVTQRNKKGNAWDTAGKLKVYEILYR